MMRTMNELQMRQIDGGYAYCKVCGYGYRNRYSDWKVMLHIASKHPAAIIRKMWQLGTGSAGAIATLIKAFR